MKQTGLPSPGVQDVTGIWERRSKEHRGQTSMATSLTAFTNLCPDFLPLARARVQACLARHRPGLEQAVRAHPHATPLLSSPQFLGPSQASS